MKKHKNMKMFICDLAACILCAIYPILFLIFRNVGEMVFAEIRIVFWCVVAFAVVVPLLMMCLMRDWGKAGIVSVIFILICENYAFLAGLIHLVFKNMEYLQIVIVLSSLFFCIFMFIKDAKKSEFFKTTTCVCCFVFGGLILVNFIGAVPALTRRTAPTATAVSTGELNVQTEGEMPNIYYFILDECASFRTIKEYYDYTDTAFRDFYEENGFTISEDSHNECIITHVILTNCLSLNYVVDESMSTNDTGAYRQEQELELYRVLQEHGYTLRGIGQTEWLEMKSISNDNPALNAHTVAGETATEIFMQQTILAPLFKHAGNEQSANIRKAFLTLQSEDVIEPDSAVFTLFYVMCPHQPFLFNADGSQTSSVNYNDWEDEQYYLGQYIYAMSETKKCVENILKNDPDCVILVTSDHGPRYKEDIAEEDKTNILNNVYFRGKAIDEIKNESGINTLRIILNRILGTDYEKVEMQ